MTVATGTRLGPYEILAPLGAGGMGEVFRARDTRLARDVALKVLPDHLRDDPKALARFENEARAVAALSHPHILAIHDFGRIDGTSFAVTELLEGETLRSLLLRGPVPPRRALEIARPLADALAAAHAKGIVHRDLKPENVFLTEGGNVKLLDFGLARHSVAALSPEETHSPTAPVLTDAGSVLGTVAYMSPEQARGLPADHRSDQFSLGVLLYEMLSGKRPFKGDSAAETLTAIIREEPEPLETLAPALPAPVGWIVDRCLAKDPDARYDSTRDLARDLEAGRSHGGSGTTAVPSGARVVRRTSRHAALRAAAAATLLATAAAAGYLAARAGRSPSPSLPRPTFTLLRSLGGSSPRPSLSPDGATLLFEAEKAPGDVDVFSLRVGGLNPVNLTADHDGYDGEARFSPDGSRIAFRSAREGGGVWVMGATGESPRRLTNEGHEPAWFPDGRRIVYSTTVVSSPNARSADGALVTVDLASGELRKLYDRRDAVQPSVSPNGLRVAFWQYGKERGGGGIFTVPAAGLADGEEAVAAATEERYRPYAPVWSADGRHLFFGSFRDGTQNLWRVAIDERSGAVSGDPEPVGLVAATTRSYSLSADGRRIVFSAHSEDGLLERYPFDLASGRVSGRPAPILRERPVIGCSGGISPDGSRLTYWTVRAGGSDVWSIATDGTGTRRLTDDGLGNRWSHYSADGRRVFFQSGRKGGQRIFSIGADGTGIEEAVRYPRLMVLQPVPSPDGRLLAVFTPGEGGRIVPLPHEPGSQLPPALPAPDEKSVFCPWSWSPDSGKLVGTADPRGEGVGTNGIWIRDLARQAWRLVRATGAEPRFLPDGRNLVVREGAGILLVDSVSGRERTLLEVPSGTYRSVVAVAPDGGSLYVRTQTVRSEIWLAQLPAAGRER